MVSEKNVPRFPSTWFGSNKKQRIMDFCIELGTVRALTGAWNPDNSFTIVGLLGMQDDNNN